MLLTYGTRLLYNFTENVTNRKARLKITQRERERENRTQKERPEREKRERENKVFVTLPRLSIYFSDEIKS